jgi:hypothetical protein
MSGMFWLGMITVPAAAQTKPAGRLIIDHKVFTRPQRQSKPLVIEATITSPEGILKAEVFCRPVGGRDFTALPMESTEGDVYRAVVPDWMTTAEGLEYYITASDQFGRSASQGFVGFPLTVRLVAPRQQTQEERLKALDETLGTIRKSRESQLPGGYSPLPGGSRDPLLDRNR